MNKTIQLIFALACLVAITAAVETRLKYRQEPLTLTEETTQIERKNFVPPSDAEVQDQWGQFKNKHGKKFNSQDEALRYKKFNDNYNLIQAANADHENNGRSLRLGVNQFADMSPEEWFAYSHGSAPGLDDNSNDPTSFFGYSESQGNLRGSKLIETEQLPTSVDWFAAGKLNPAKNQGACGSCWTFSATGALEGLYKIKNPNSALQLFSQQQLVDCTNKATSTWGMYGCSGGSQTTAFRYVANQSIALASQYPYKAANGTCYYNSSMAFYNTYSIGSPNGYLNVPRNNSLSMKTQVAKQPVSVSLWASTSTFQLYKSGVYNEANCGLANGVLQVNHGVLISGYGVNVVNSTYSENYWIVQNSWGTTWGNNGNIWVGYTPDAAIGTVTNPGTCGIHMYGAAPTPLP